MQASEILEYCQDNGVQLWVNGDTLQYKPASKLPPELLPEIRKHKSEIIHLISTPPEVCRCQPPMPIADIDSKPCSDCGIACWCIACGGCRWCQFEEEWAGQLVVK